MPNIWLQYSGQASYSKRQQAWVTPVAGKTKRRLTWGQPIAPHHERLTPFVDSYHDEHLVAVEHGSKEQMRARWHLMKM